MIDTFLMTTFLRTKFPFLFGFLLLVIVTIIDTYDLLNFSTFFVDPPHGRGVDLHIFIYNYYKDIDIANMIMKKFWSTEGKGM